LTFSSLMEQDLHERALPTPRIPVGRWILPCHYAVGININFLLCR
jgi:hypothetical protein